jgi:hypothetical protein
MPDAVGYRMKFGVIVPSTNTVVEADYNRMAPHGVTFHTGRMYIGQPAMDSDDAFQAVLGQIHILHLYPQHGPRQQRRAAGAEPAHRPHARRAARRDRTRRAVRPRPRGPGDRPGVRGVAAAHACAATVRRRGTGRR